MERVGWFHLHDIRRRRVPLLSSYKLRSSPRLEVHPDSLGVGFAVRATVSAKESVFAHSRLEYALLFLPIHRGPGVLDDGTCSPSKHLYDVS